MNETTVSSLIERVGRLERKNRRWQLAGSGALIAMVALLLMGQAVSPRTENLVESKEFRVLDSAGRVRIKLSTLTDGSPHLLLLDGGGKQRAALLMRPNDAVELVLADRAGLPRVGLALGTDGSPTLGFIDNNAKVIWKAP